MMIRSRSPLWHIGAILILASAVGSLFAADSLSFLALGDWGRDGKYGQAENAKQMALSAAALHSRFVLALGDNFYPSGVKSINDPQWKSSYENVYKEESLQIPWYAALGNHDYTGSAQAEIDYTRTSKRWRMPARYYTWTEKIDEQTTVQFFALDTNPFISAYRATSFYHGDISGQDPRKQLRWLETELAASKAQWKIAFGHHPIYSGGRHGDTPEIITNILPLLQKYHVQAYINGHDHILEHLHGDGLECFTAGAGSQTTKIKSNPRSIFAYDKTSGFLAATLTSETMHIEFISDEGKVLYTTDVSIGSRPKEQSSK